MINDEDEKAAKAYADAEQDVRPWSIAYAAVLYGIELERKRRNKVMAQHLMEAAKAKQDIEQIKEKHWRIKDGDTYGGIPRRSMREMIADPAPTPEGFDEKFEELEQKLWDALPEPEYLSKLAGNE